MKENIQTNLGIFYGLFAFIFWGLVPIYFKLVSSVPAIEVLMHRVVWSVIFILLFIITKKEFYLVIRLLKDTTTSFYLCISSVIIGANWLTFIWAIEHNQIIETSLGYYINPLVTIFFGFIFLSEMPTKNQKIAIFLAFLSVCYQLYFIGYFPTVSLILAITFPTYGLIRKKIRVNSLVGLFVETLFLLPLALGYFYFLQINAQNHFSISNDLNLSILLIFSGIVTVLPLLAFTSATKLLKLTTIGFLQYIGPSVSFLLAIFVYNEPISKEKLLSFSLIWIALFIVTLDSFKRKKT